MPIRLDDSCTFRVPKPPARSREATQAGHSRVPEEDMFPTETVGAREPNRQVEISVPPVT